MTDITEVANGLRFPEGPIAMPDGCVILVEIERQTLSCVSPTGDVSVLAELGGGPNGASDQTVAVTSATMAVLSGISAPTAACRACKPQITKAAASRSSTCKAVRLKRCTPTLTGANCGVRTIWCSIPMAGSGLPTWAKRDNATWTAALSVTPRQTAVAAGK